MYGLPAGQSFQFLQVVQHTVWTFGAVNRALGEQEYLLGKFLSLRKEGQSEELSRHKYNL